MFLREQLVEKGDIPELFNFDGMLYCAKDIVGHFSRDKKTSKIMLLQQKEFEKARISFKMDPSLLLIKQQTNYMLEATPEEDTKVYLDTSGRRVNKQGYLIDDEGNIVTRSSSRIIWKKELLRPEGEPQKIFKFTEFSMSWVRGLIEPEQAAKAIKETGKAVDYEQRPVNDLGFLVDELGNIVDAMQGLVVFPQRFLEIDRRSRKQVQLPYIFRSGKLLQIPMSDPLENELELRL
mmetsp:Transcript_14118/g.21994  ORF Transcript_14118/g.21994 Transcript_14118/m.21994 type:complete len:235 (+) Transcript_14118:2863-3567(+)